MQFTANILTWLPDQRQNFPYIQGTGIDHLSVLIRGIREDTTARIRSNIMKLNKAGAASNRCRIGPRPMKAHRKPTKTHKMEQLLLRKPQNSASWTRACCTNTVHKQGFRALHPTTPLWNDK
jgi:hypothetical protein